MTELRKTTHNPMSFARLMRLGQVSHAQGDNKAAHAYWRQAAILEPDNEQVWTALMWVIEDDEDRKVCLKNILAINPKNLRAQDMLDELIGDTQADERVNAQEKEETKESPESHISFGYLVLRFAQILWLGGLIALLISALRFVF